jgi:hypothetical protein
VKPFLVAVLFAALAGCASSSGVIARGDGVFQITSSAITSFGGAGTAARDGFKRANDYCAASGKRAELIDNRTDAQFTGATVNVSFRCVAQ